MIYHSNLQQMVIIIFYLHEKLYREERHESSLLSELKYENLLYIEHPKKRGIDPMGKFFSRNFCCFSL